MLRGVRAPGLCVFYAARPSEQRTLRPPAMEKQRSSGSGCIGGERRIHRSPPPPLQQQPHHQQPQPPRPWRRQEQKAEAAYKPQLIFMHESKSRGPCGGTLAHIDVSKHSDPFFGRGTRTTVCRRANKWPAALATSFIAMHRRMDKALQRAVVLKRLTHLHVQAPARGCPQRNVSPTLRPEVRSPHPMGRGGQVPDTDRPVASPTSVWRPTDKAWPSIAAKTVGRDDRTESDNR